MINKKLILKEKFSKISEHWSPKIIAEMNDYQFKLAKVKINFGTNTVTLMRLSLS